MSGADTPASARTADAAATLVASPQWTTPEFWSRVTVDLLGIAAMLLTFFTGSDKGIQGAEALVPAAALVASALAHAVYSHSRMRLRIAALAHAAATAETELRRLEHKADQLAPVAEALDPTLATRVRAAEAAGKQVAGQPPA